MTPTTDLAEKLEAEASNSEIHGTLDAAYLCRQAADTLRKQAEELERCRTALRPFAKEAADNWSQAALANELPVRLILPDSKNEYKARFSMADLERARSAYNEPKQNGEAK